MSGQVDSNELLNLLDTSDLKAAKEIEQLILQNLQESG